MFDEDIMEIADVDLKAGVAAIVHHVAPVFQSIERHFPTTGNRISWDELPEVRQADVFPARSGARHAHEVQQQLERQRATLASWFGGAGLADQVEATWVGDGTSIGLRLSIGLLLERFPALFSLPQHSYVIPTDGLWCLNYVMEGALYFGFSADL